MIRGIRGVQLLTYSQTLNGCVDGWFRSKNRQGICPLLVGHFWQAELAMRDEPIAELKGRKKVNLDTTKGVDT